MHRSLFILAFLSAGIAAAADKPTTASGVPLMDFARYAKVTDMKISPDGKYVAESRLLEGKATLVVVRLADKKMTSAYNFGSDRRIDDYWWVGPERLVITFGEERDAFVQPLGTGELLAVDADNSKGDGSLYLYGARGSRSTLDTHIPPPQADDRWATVIRPLSDKPDSAIIQINDFEHAETAGGANVPIMHVGSGEVDRIDVNNGYRRKIAGAPAAGETDFLTDRAGNPLYAVTEDQHFNHLAFAKTSAEGDWKLLNPEESSNLRVDPLALSKDERRAFLRSNEGGDRMCIVEHDLAADKDRALSCDEYASAGNAILSFDGQDVIGALYEGLPPWERLVDTSNEGRATLQKLMAAFPGQIVVPISVTTDGSKAVLFVHSDRNPGDYYLFEPKTLKADYLDSERDWIDPDQMSERRPIEYKTRDGAVIHGFLTLPRGKDPKGLPLVVYPHGGPLEIMDTWDWEATPQMLASRGYAVLQVNYRGSSGYGSGFVNAGRKHWDSVMIDDITDGTRWTVKQGIADPGRICIFGASYGGYAALMSAVKEPDLYRCVIGYAGAYDLVKWKKSTDIADEFISDYVGDDEHLAAASPIKYLDHLKAAIMIVHGEADQRVPFSQAKELAAALDARHYPYVWLTKEEEGHGFFNEKNKAELYEKAIAFLDKNIGADAAPANPATASASESTPSLPH